MNPHLFELLHQDPDVTKHFNCEKKYILTFVNKYFSPKEKLAFETDYPPPPPPPPPKKHGAKNLRPPTHFFRAPHH
jgi:hypothetical protein